MNINLQKDWKDCGLYCLESFYNYYYNKEIDMAILKNAANYGHNGINILELNKVANKIALKIEPFKINFNELLSYKNKKPFMALIKLSTYSHYVIIKRKNKKYFYILDPSNGKTKISIKDFKVKFLGIILLISKNGKTPIKNSNNVLFEYFLENKKILLFVIALLVIISISNLIAPYFIKLVVDKVLPSNGSKFLNLLLIFFTWLTVLKLSSLFWTNFLKNKIFLSIKIEIRNKIIFNFIHATKHDVEKLSTVDWFRRLDMADGLVEYFANLLSVLIKDIIILFTSLVFLLSINTKLIYICIFSSLILFSISILFRNEKNKKITKLLDTSLLLNISYFDIFNRHLQLKNSNNAKYLINNNNKKVNKNIFQEYNVKSLMNWNSLISEAVLQLSYILIIYLGTSELLANKLSLGNLLLFLSMFSLFSGSFHSISNSFLEWTNAKKSYDLVSFVINLKNENLNKKGIKIQKIYNIFIDGLIAEYELGHESLNIKKLLINGNINLLGNNGSGKTTLFRVLYGYLQYSGNIFINGINLNEIDKSFLREKIFISDNEWLPNIPFKNYLSNNNQEYETLIKNFKKYKIDVLLMKNNIDINTSIENNGNNYSLGQKKIITILPLFSRQYELILLDEIFENIDINNQKILRKGILSFHDKKVIINISHNRGNIFKFKKEYKIV